MNNIQRGHVTCHMEDISLLRSFGEGHVYSENGAFATTSAKLGDVYLCLAKRSYTCEINDLAQSLIRSFPLKFLP
jgi:hypothetical protein